MIKEIILQNFQSHEFSTLELSPGVNIIVGSSDSGKTAILRAIKLAVKNRPNGNDFISHWGGETRVELLLDDGTIISRVKTKNHNAYEISSTETPDHKELTAFGTEVPQEVQELLNISDTCIQGQLDAPFLLTSSPGEVASHFNKVAHLEDIDLCIKNITKALNGLDSQIKYDREAQTLREEKLKTFDYLERFEIEVEVLEQIEDRAAGISKTRATVKALLKEVEKIETEIQQFSNILEAETLVDNILSIYGDKTAVEDRKNGLSRVLSQIEDTEIQIQDLSEVIEAETPVDNLLKLYEARDEISKTRAALIKTGQQIATVENTIKEKEETVQKLETQFQKAFPEICPLCDTNLKTKPHSHDKTK